MKYYLVALFDEDSYSYIETIQKNLCKQYKLYRHVPMLHITLEVICNPTEIDYLWKIVQDFLRPYKKFKIQINGAICFDAPYKSVNLKIENKGYIMKLARNINDLLKLHGFMVRENIDNWDLHIALANTNYAIREWSNNEYIAACDATKKEDIHRMAKIDRIELWKPINNKKEMILKSLSLPDY